ncbi:MAG: hypothetical protein JWR07_3791 [Nevskia sp.]|nr:hypothetical protein [Nevskia sp.]
MNRKALGMANAFTGDVAREEALLSTKKARRERAIQLACTWSGVPMVLLLFIGLWPIAGFIPPLHPWASGSEIAEIYRTQTLPIRFGLAMSLLSITFLFSFGAAIAGQARRIEGVSPVLTYIQVSGFASGTLIFIIPWICWLTAAFRPERSDSEIMLLNDLGWITFVTAFVAFFAWNFALGLAILSDTREKPVFPRWSGYFNFFVGMSFVPDICVPFFKRGVFSWEGIFPFYLPFFVYFVWILSMMWLTSKAINEDPALAPASVR